MSKSLDKIISLLSNDSPAQTPGMLDDAHGIGDTTPYTAAPRSSSEVQAADDSTSKQKQDNILSNASNNAQGIVDTYNRGRMQNVDPYYNYLHGKGNVRGNINRRSSAATLNLSRAADALNNRRHLKPEAIGGGHAGFNQGMLRSERWDPIETQEMRQMRANENVDLAQRNRDVNRSADVLDYRLELQKKADSNKLYLQNALGMNDVSMDAAYRQAYKRYNYDMPYEQYFQQQLMQFSNELSLRTKDRVMKLVAGIYANNPDMAAWASTYYGAGTPPTMQQLADSKLGAELYRLAGGDYNMWQQCLYTALSVANNVPVMYTAMKVANPLR